MCSNINLTPQQLRIEYTINQKNRGNTVSTPTIDFNISTGGEIAEQENAKMGGGFQAQHWMPTLKNEEVIVMRFLTDYPEWITVRQHAMVPTKPQPSGWQGKKWPLSMSASCRRDKLFAGFYSDCYIDGMTKDDGKKYTAPNRTWANACIRDEVKGTQEMADSGKITVNQIGKAVGYKDRIREIEEFDKDGKPTGQKIQEKDVVIVCMGYENFFQKISGTYESVLAQYGEGTILNRDFWIKRKGMGLDTTYIISPLDPTVGHDLRDPEIAATYGEVVDSGKRPGVKVISTKVIQDIIVQRSTDDYFATFFDVTKEAPAQKNPDGTKVSTEKQSNDAPPPVQSQESVDAVAYAALQDKIRGFSTADQPDSPSTGMQNFS
jgi:hypothetical protein